MWLSLVEYLNGVQGVGGSNPLTQTSPSVLTEFEFVRTPVSYTHLFEIPVQLQMRVEV